MVTGASYSMNNSQLDAYWYSFFSKNRNAAENAEMTNAALAIVDRRANPLSFAKGIVGVEEFPNFAKYSLGGGAVPMAQQATVSAILDAPKTIATAAAATAGAGGDILSSFGAGLGITSTTMLAGLAAVAAIGFLILKK